MQGKLVSVDLVGLDHVVTVDDDGEQHRLHVATLTEVEYL